MRVERADLETLYFNLRQLLAAVASRREADAELRWACEDLEEAMLDLKIAFVADDRVQCDLVAEECLRLMEEIVSSVSEDPGTG